MITATAILIHRKHDMPMLSKTKTACKGNQIPHCYFLLLMMKRTNSVQGLLFIFIGLSPIHSSIPLTLMQRPLELMLPVLVAHLPFCQNEFVTQ